ncbi:MAG: tetratricopeptide repeat protein, partial [Bacteroidota bacterium]
GYGRLLNKHVTAGGSVNFIRSDQNFLSLSLGGSLHLPDSISPYSGFLAGFSVQNVPAPRSSFTNFNVGAAYWLLPNALRVQTAWQLEHDRGNVLVGTEWRMASGFSIYAGTVALQNFSGGVGYRSDRLEADVAVGRRGISVSFTFPLSAPARDVHRRSFDEGLRAYDAGRYWEAQTHFHHALLHDEYSHPAQTLFELSNRRMETASAAYYREGQEQEEHGNYDEAAKLYSLVLRVNPHHSDAKHRLEEAKLRLSLKIQLLTILGDSLKHEKELGRAQSVYQEALGLTPDNQQIQLRLQEIDSMIVERQALRNERVQLHLIRAKDFLAKNQIALARKEYEEILLLDPNHTQARRGFKSLDDLQTTKGLFEQGQRAFDEGNYLEALHLLTEVLKRDEQDKEARSYLARARDSLAQHAEQFYKTGLQHYAEGNFTASLEYWNRVLLIQPDNQTVLGYIQRAQEKLDAFRRLY